MALRIEHPETERLAAEVAAMTGESPAEAIRRALAERRDRLSHAVDRGNRAARVRRFLEQEVWPTLPPSVRGKKLSKEEEERILGYGPEGV